MENYNDIIGLPHHRSKIYAPMPRATRAAQFAPFAALTGLDDAVSETERLTSEKPKLGEEEAAELNYRLNLLNENIGEKPTVIVTYFVEDKRKSGGACVTVKAVLKHIDNVERRLETEDRLKIPIDDIINIEVPGKEDENE